jgi:hypothetical protein
MMTVVAVAVAVVRKDLMKKMQMDRMSTMKRMDLMMRNCH